MNLYKLLPYDKSIWLYPNGFCLVESTGSQRCKSFSYADGDILSVNAIDFFQLSASEKPDIAVVLANNAPVIVPNELYTPENEEKYLHLQTDVANLSRIFTHEVDAYKLLSYISKNENNALERIPANLIFEGYWSLLVRSLRIEKPNTSISAVFVYDNFLDFYIEDKKNILLVNRIDYVKPEDALYHIINIRQQYAIDSNEICIYPQNSFSALKSLVKKYVTAYSWND